MTVADYCDAMNRNEIIVNKNYQRSDQVWPDIARSFLIESILLGFPLPKIYLLSITDLKSKKTIKEIVDGQQRSNAIRDYFNDGYRLSKDLETDEIQNLSYSELPEEWQARFISYSISFDQIFSDDDDEVVQIFRRMNSYTVPLNPEELRNAEYQGPFKWFIYEKSRKFEPGLSRLGAFGKKGFVRMQDLKLLTEIVHALEHGVSTTNKKVLDSVYRKYNQRFAGRREISNLLDLAFDRICEMTYLSDSNLAKPYMLYSLALAIISKENDIPGFSADRADIEFESRSLESRLMEMDSALDLDDARAKGSPFYEFIGASSSRTNVKVQRETRIRWFLAALHGARL